MTSKTWLITGCSSGIGSEFAYGVLRRGDIAIATTRGDVSRLGELKKAGAHVYSLDITASIDDIIGVVVKMLQEIGGIDVLVNNAGYIEAGLIEEMSHESWVAQFETNVFGTVKMTQALLPHFRARKQGTIITIGSLAGWRGDPAAAAYCGSKFALEAFYETLAQETAPFGIKSILFEPGLFRTNVFQRGTLKWSTDNLLPELDQFRGAVQAYVEDMNAKQPGNPKKAVEIMIDVTKGEGVAKGRKLPARLPLGRDSLLAMQKKCEETLGLLKEWEEVIGSTDY